MKTVYLFDPATGIPLGEHQCQVCAVTQDPLIPTNSLPDAPPAGPLGLIYRAQGQAWVFDLIRSSQEEIKRVDATHSDMLLKFTGNPAPSEVATWDGKVTMAEAILADQPLTASQKAFLEASSAVGSDAKDFAKSVIEKSRRYWTLVGTADKLRTSCRERVLKAKDALSFELALIANAADTLSTLSAVTATQ